MRRLNRLRGAGEPLVILAAGGAVALEVACGSRLRRAATFWCIALEGEADQRLKAFPHAIVKWGQIGRVEALINAHGGRDLVLIGAVSQRPDFSSMGVDFGTLRYLPRILKSMVGGDDTHPRQSR